jgi:hypothetical protein
MLPGSGKGAQQADRMTRPDPESMSRAMGQHMSLQARSPVHITRSDCITAYHQFRSRSVQVCCPNQIIKTPPTYHQSVSAAYRSVQHTNRLKTGLRCATGDVVVLQTAQYDTATDVRQHSVSVCSWPTAATPGKGSTARSSNVTAVSQAVHPKRQV